MCGISGFFTLDENKFSSETLEAMNKALRHRGPDADGIFLKPPVGLAHRRLSIIDLSAKANQPMISLDGRYLIIFNGEVYNYKDLAMLHLKDKPLKSHSDTEVILELFASKGPSIFSELRGMFAGAIYDQINEELFLFRDPWGKKPVFYYKEDQCIVFASEIKALRQVKGLKFELNRSAIAQFMHLNFIPEPNTIFTKVFKLKAGHYLKVSKTSIQEHSFLPKIEINKQNQKLELIDVKRELRQLLEKSVAYRLITDVPFGALLSGGVDSSLITAIAQQISPGRLKTFTIGFQEAWFDESPYARKIASYLGTEHYELTLEVDDAIALIDKIFTVFDEPFADTSSIPTLMVSQLVKQTSKMVLTGDGGDELFLGYGTHIWAQRLSDPLVRSFHKPISVALNLMGDKFQKASRMLNYRSGTNMQSHIFSQEQGFFADTEMNSILRPEYRLLDVNSFKLTNEYSTPDATIQALWETKYYLKEDLLVKMDRASMHNSLEMRSPFLDRQIADYAFQLPQEMKLNNGNGKYILKEILKDYIPAAYVDRPKQGFSIPLSKWLRVQLRNLVDVFASEKITEEYGIFEVAAVTKIRDAYLSGNDYFYHKLWLIICLHKWLRVNNVEVRKVRSEK